MYTFENYKILLKETEDLHYWEVTHVYVSEDLMLLKQQ